MVKIFIKIWNPLCQTCRSNCWQNISQIEVDSFFFLVFFSPLLEFQKLFHVYYAVLGNYTNWKKSHCSNSSSFEYLIFKCFKWKLTGFYDQFFLKFFFSKNSKMYTTECIGIIKLIVSTDLMKVRYQKAGNSRELSTLCF